MVCQVESVFKVWTVYVRVPETEVVVCKCCIEFYHASVLRFDPKVCISIMKSRETKIIGLLTNQTEVNSNIHITVTHTPGIFFIPGKLLCSYTHNNRRDGSIYFRPFR